MNYLIPTNTKKGALILGVFRLFDLILFGSGLAITFLLLLLIPNVDGWTTAIILAPVVITGALVLPIPNYHNVLVVIQEIITFLNTRQKLIWRGWCAKYGEDDSKK